MSEPGPALLPARSVLLSVLLGSHPPSLPVRTLVRTAGLFGISEGTARVALSRLGADGEVVADGGTYRLSPRHLERQHDQDVALRPATRPWRGGWDIVVLLPDPDGRAGTAGPDARRSGPDAGRSGPDTRRPLERRRMAELRPGVWTRPDNLVLPGPPWTPAAGAGVTWTARPAPGGTPPQELAGRLWDLPGWAKQAEAVLEAMARADEPAVRLSVGATMVRLIRADPVLPPALVPDAWPGRRLRRGYDAYRAELGRMIAQLRDG